LDDMEYPSLTGAASVFVPENCSVSGTIVAVEGNYALNIEGTGTSGTITKTENLDLSNMSGLSIWNRGDTGASQNYTLWMEDSVGNISYWYEVTNASVSIWELDTVDLTTPDGNNGENADLSDITNWGFKIPENLDFKIDTVEAECGMCVAIDGVDSSSYYQNVYVSNTPTTPTRQSSPIITAPITNSRIDILYLNKDEELNFLVGDELATPVPDWDSVTGDMFLICLIYCRPGMVKIVDFINHEANPSEGYILADIRPLFTGKSGFDSGLDASKSASPLVGDSYLATDTEKLYVCYVEGTWVNVGQKTYFLGFSIPGIAQIDTKLAGVLIKGNWEIVTSHAYSDTAPTGASLILDVNINGTSAYTTQGNRPTILATEYDSGETATPDVVSLSDGDRLTVDIDQVGSTISGGDNLYISIEVVPA